MIRMLWTSFVAALAAIPIVLAAQDERPAFRSSIDVIPIPVRVLDEAGRPVEDLAARDFIVRFDGADRTVVSAARVSALDAPEAKRPAPSRSYSTNDQASSPVTRTILFVFDASGLNTSTARAVGSEIERFLDKADAGDLIGITTLPVGVAVAPTTDRELVRATARKLAGAAEPSSSRFQITPGEAIGFEREDRGLMEDVVSRECFGFSDPACAQLVERDAKLMARTLRESVRRRLRTLVAVIEALPPTAEPKHIVLATAGMPHEPGLQSYYRDVPERLAARAATLSILRIESSAGTAESRLMTTGPDWRLMAEALVLMASASGGDLIEAGTASTRFERFRQELGAYYLVGISASPQDLDGKPHRVVVAVRGAGMVVQHSPTFARPRTSPRQEQLEQLLAASMERTGTTRAIPLGVQTTIVRGQDPKRLEAIVIVR
ncbi:MAG TPA: hypothetical protein VFO58_00600, partial [Vicinamibacterales bacterium]|nr:hypothetical protein [Vicinamibacterales bacterium]